MKNKGNHLNLKVGDRIQIGKESAKLIGSFAEGAIITLVEGYFDYDNGLYTETQTAPSYYDEKYKEWDSIFHIFGNNLEDFLDSKVI